MLAKGHDLRNLAEYEGDLEITDKLVDDLVVACQAVAEVIEAFN